MSTLSLGLGLETLDCHCLWGCEKYKSQGQEGPRVTQPTVGEAEIRALAVLHQNLKFVQEIGVLLDPSVEKSGLEALEKEAH